MQTFTTYVVVFTIGLVGAYLLATREPTQVDWAQQQAELNRIERQEAAADAAQPTVKALAPVWPLVPFVATVGLLAYLGGLGSAQVTQRWTERKADARGLLPVPAVMLAQVAPATLGAYHVARIEEARRPLVPTVPGVMHYAPHIAYKGSDAMPANPVAVPVAESGLPGLTDLASLSFTPGVNSILLGLGPGGERITVPAKALCHVALVGATGGGKSNLLRLLLPQLQAVGARIVLADPHFTPLDPETGEDWRAIAARLHLAPAVSPNEIGGLLAYLSEELQRRLELRRTGFKWGPSLFLALDELPVIADTVPGATESLGKLLREGRKVGLYTIGAAQSFLVKVIGGDSSAREAYRTAFYVGGDLRSAATLLDMAQRDIAESAVGAGVAYLRSVATNPARLVQVPFASNGAIATLLGPTSGGSGAEVATEVATEVGSGVQLPTQQQAVAWTAEEARILAALKAGQGPGEVAESLAGGKGGRKYQQASTQVAAVIRRAIG